MGALRLAEQRSMSDIVNEALRVMLQEDEADLAAFDERAHEPLISLDSLRAELESEGITRKVRPMAEVVAEIRALQHAAGHVPPTREEVERYIEEERASWDRP